MKNYLSLVFAITLILLGLFGLLGAMKILTITWVTFWPVFLLIPAVFFEIGFFLNRKLYGLLVPGGILLILSALFFLCNFTSYNLMVYLWPVFIMAPGLGLLQMYFLGNHAKGVFIGGMIPFGISCIFLFFTSLRLAFFSYFFPIALIVIGLFFFLKSFSWKK